jgi:hypothetical protein
MRIEKGIENVDRDRGQNWDDDTDNSNIYVNPLKISYDHYGEFDKKMFTAHQVKSITYKQALGGNDAAKWKIAIQKELDAMDRYSVWDIVPKPKGKQVIPLKWIFSIKKNGVYKARLVVVGCRDKNKASKIETASPTPSAASIRWLLVIVSKFGWEMIQLDLVNAFLNGKIDREKYVSIPQGLDADPKKLACRLKKALYGLDIAPICFNRELNSFLESLGFTRNPREPCIYTRKEGGLITLLLTFVDDLVLTGNDTAGMNRILEALSKRYEIKNLGFPKTFVGIEIERRENRLFLHQESYSKAIVQQFYMAEQSNLQVSKWSVIPMPPLSTHKDIAIIEHIKTFPYRQAIGALIYLANYTRLDLSFPIHYLARFQTQPKSIHWTLVQRILYYISKTSGYGILCPIHDQNYSSSDTPGILDAYVDADHAGDSSRKSTTGFVVRLFETPVTWCSRLQRSIAEHTCEAELIALNEAAHEVLFIARLTHEILDLQEVFPATLYEDNFAAMQQASTNVGRGKLKHIEICYLKIREYISKKLLKVEQVSTVNQLADILTKPLLQQTFTCCRDNLLRSFT